MLLKLNLKDRFKHLKSLITSFQREQLSKCAGCKNIESVKVVMSQSSDIYHFGEVFCQPNKNLSLKEYHNQKRYSPLEIPKWKKYGITPKGPLTNQDILKIIELETGSKYLSFEDYLLSPTKKIKGSYKHTDEYNQGRMTPEQMLERRNIYRKRLETVRQNVRKN
jgi:hypothetical protein